MANLLMAKYSAAASTQWQSRMAMALFILSNPIKLDQDMVLLRLERPAGSPAQVLNLGKLPGKSRLFERVMPSSIDRRLAGRRLGASLRGERHQSWIARAVLQ